MSRASLMTKTFIAVLFTLLAVGCDKARSTAVPFNATTGAHPKTWLQDHWAEYLKNPKQCQTCHGSTTDPAQAGGISKVSCFTCHTQGAVHHAGWDLAAQHGRLGAELAPVATIAPAVPVMAGFSHCAKCHGANYDGGLSAVSCKSCHTIAPHPGKPWFDATGAKPSHAMVNAANLAECAKCHAGGANSDLKPATPAPAGTQPGCFNATLCHSTGAHTTTWLQDHWTEYLKNPAACATCHGSITDPSGGIAKMSCVSCHTQGVPHPAGFAAAAVHGANSAMLASVATGATTVPVMAGFDHCAKCHGSNLDGGLTAISCMSCHKTSPHPAKPWLADTGSVPLSGHPKTDVKNLGVCAGCHLNGKNSDIKPGIPAPAGTQPGCFNATLCHG